MNPMKFQENLPILRKQAGLTQEALAERLAVSRQSVSKWESGAAMPELDKLLAMAEMFGCTVDSMLREDLSERDSRAETEARRAEKADRQAEETFLAYDDMQNFLARTVAAGVGLIFLGLVLMLALMTLWGEDGTLPVVLLLMLIAGAVYLFILAGSREEAFEKRHPAVADRYTEAERLREERTFPNRMAGCVVLIFLGVILVILLGMGIPETSSWIYLVPAAFLLCIGMAVMGFIYFGILHDRFDVEKYNRKQRRKRLEADGQPSVESISDNLSGIIMLTATAIYLLCGFVWGNWHPSWVVFPIGGLLCAILESVLKLRGTPAHPPAAPDASGESEEEKRA